MLTLETAEAGKREHGVLYHKKGVVTEERVFGIKRS